MDEAGDNKRGVFGHLGELVREFVQKLRFRWDLFGICELVGDLREKPSARNTKIRKAQARRRGGKRTTKS
jgi:hypothetical protein